MYIPKFDLKTFVLKPFKEEHYFIIISDSAFHYLGIFLSLLLIPVFLVNASSFKLDQQIASDNTLGQLLTELQLYCIVLRAAYVIILT